MNLWSRVRCSAGFHFWRHVGGPVWNCRRCGHWDVVRRRESGPYLYGFTIAEEMDR